MDSLSVKLLGKFCKGCGSQHSEAKYFPNRVECEVCDKITWLNPFPVAVLLQPVSDGERTGIVVGLRGINPGKGTYGLVGGFIDPNDGDAIVAARREFWEETGIEAPDYDDMELFWSFSTKEHLLVFVLSNTVLDADTVLSSFKPNHECPAIRIAWEPETLSFELHSLALARYFSKSRVPNATTIAAIEACERGETKKVETIEELLGDLNDAGC